MDTPGPQGDQLKTFLAERDAPCPNCGYNLRGLTSDRCPECEHGLVLSVGLAEPRIAAFVFGLLGVGMSVGFSALLLAWVGLMFLRRGRGGMPPRSDLVPLVASVAVGGTILALLVTRRRRWFGRLSPAGRWWAAVAATLVALAFPVWFMLAVN